MLQELVKFRSKYWSLMSYSEKVVISMLIEKEKERIVNDMGVME